MHLAGHKIRFWREAHDPPLSAEEFGLLYANPAKDARHANMAPPSNPDRRIKSVSGVNKRAPASASIRPLPKLFIHLP